MSGADSVSNPVVGDEATAEPVYIQLIPAIPADAHYGRATLFVSGFSANDEPRILQESRIVLQLAWCIFSVGVALRLMYLIFLIALGYPFADVVISSMINIFFTGLVLWCGIEGVKTRNAKCGCGECCGFLMAFFVIYIILAIGVLISAIVGLVTKYYVGAIISFIFFVLYAFCLDHTRKLLNAIEENKTRPRTVMQHDPPEAPSTHIELATVETITSEKNP